jgi:hypothetical protein
MGMVLLYPAHTLPIAILKQGSWWVFILFFFPGYLLFPFSKPFSVFKTN